MAAITPGFHWRPPSMILPPRELYPNNECYAILMYQYDTPQLMKVTCALTYREIIYKLLERYFSENFLKDFSCPPAQGNIIRMDFDANGDTYVVVQR